MFLRNKKIIEVRPVKTGKRATKKNKAKNTQLDENVESLTLQQVLTIPLLQEFKRYSIFF